MFGVSAKYFSKIILVFLLSVFVLFKADSVFAADKVPTGGKVLIQTDSSSGQSWVNYYDASGNKTSSVGPVTYSTTTGTWTNGSNSYVAGAINGSEYRVYSEQISTTGGGYGASVSGTDTYVWSYDSNGNIIDENYQGKINTNGTSLTNNNGTVTQDDKKSEGGECSFFSPSEWLPMCVLEPLGYGILKIGTLALYLAGLVLDFTVDKLVIGMGTLYKEGIKSGVEEAWKILRDIANSIFIFILLFAAFNTVIGRRENGLSLLPRIITVALLMNFSLMFSQAVIDVSNAMASISYEKLTSDGDVKSSKISSKSISTTFIDQTKLSTIFSSTNSGFSVDGLSGSGTNSQYNSSGLKGYNFFVFAIFSTLFLLILAVYFLVLSVMFLGRFVVLIILMIVSILAFLSYLIPSFQKHTSEWWKTLIGQSFFAPAVLILLYATLLVQKNVNAKIASTSSTSFVQLFTNPGDSGAFQIVLTFFVLIGMLVASIVLAKKLSEIGSKGVLSIGQRANTFVAGAAVGLAGAGLRGTLGRAGNAITNSQGFNRWTENTKLGRVVGTPLRGVAGAASKGSFDFRRSQVAGLVKKHAGLDVGKPGSGEGGFVKDVEKRSNILKDKINRSKEFDYSHDDKSKKINDALVNSRGKKGDALRDAHKKYQTSNANISAEIANAKSALSKLESDKKNNTNSWATAGFDAQIAKAKAAIKEKEGAQIKISKDWTKAQNQYLFGHPEIGNFSEAHAHRASARDWMTHIGGAAAIAGGVALGGAPIGLAVGALAGGRALSSTIRYVRNPNGARGMARMSEAVAEKHSTEDAAKRVAKLRYESEMKRMKKIMATGQSLSPEDQVKFDNMKKGGVGENS